jgi:hypothetical protein
VNWEQVAAVFAAALRPQEGQLKDNRRILAPEYDGSTNYTLYRTQFLAIAGPDACNNDE